ncbi:MAG: DUF547 domain-containing protein [Chthoniobacterales bacterium]
MANTRYVIFALLLGAALLLPALSRLCRAADQKNAEVKSPSGIDHSAWDRLLKKHVDDNGLVNYAAWKNNEDDVEALDRYLKQFAAKADKPAEGKEKAASLVNAYNAIAIRTILGAYPVDSIHEVGKPFEAKQWIIGGEKVSLNDIEHGTLRPMLKYRAHSVLVCVARSCPPLQRFAYSAEAFDSQNDSAYTRWLGREDLNKFLPEKNKAEISSIFKWFESDFETSKPVAKVLAEYGPRSAKELTSGGKKFNISYISYNWGLNDQGEHGRDYSKLDLAWDSIFR